MEAPYIPHAFKASCLVRLSLIFFLNGSCRTAPGSRAGGGAHEMGSRLSTLATCGFRVRTPLEATNG